MIIILTESIVEQTAIGWSVKHGTKIASGVYTAAMRISSRTALNHLKHFTELGLIRKLGVRTCHPIRGGQIMNGGATAPAYPAITSAPRRDIVQQDPPRNESRHISRRNGGIRVCPITEIDQ